MKGIYLTEEGKKEIQSKISEIENYTYATQNIWIEGQNSGMLKILEDILSSSESEPNIYTKEDMFESFSRYAFSSTSSQPYNEEELKEEFEKFIENLGNSKK